MVPQPLENAQRPLWRKTPLIESAELSKQAGCRIFLKLENLQPSGSFKSRGIGNFCATALHNASAPDNVHFYSSSGGNAGLACVHAANSLGRPSTVVVPLSTNKAMMAKIKAAGATDVVQFGTSWSEADTYLREIIIKQARDQGEEPIYVHPFDHPDLWAGHSTLVKEIAQTMNDLGETAPDAVACSVGGGGLLMGVIDGVAQQGQSWQTTKVIAIETKGADSMSQSLHQKQLVTLPGITSIASSLGAVRVARRPFEQAMQWHASERLSYAVITDDEAKAGCIGLADAEQILVEPACGVTVALSYNCLLSQVLGRQVHKEDKVVIVVCGGSNISTEMIEQWRRQ
ncbi:Hypothetical protein R9X50_00768300 [Acrodontium crateriforme]|uniref:L-serine ammonia-lyase n=1 Tax=Acrodontium crateriforme TaxID=150365 RepID=A0AAQ3ME32_9PEZI|nr:Hypothetical protein R9X50_00768300 [Acrodontium crateriforme]